jgi:UDP-N-acetylglucosamine--N-acetylmuramyl-(pentapeptide) pyrophosphoryl-undecaprenol N-acetylglucosamine transferase
MRKNILITTGGSGGHVIPATIIYEHLKDKYNVHLTSDRRGIKFLKKEKYKIKIYQQTNTNNFKQLKNYYSSNTIESEIFDFNANISDIMNKSNICITRAGASTLAELIFMNIPHLAIPLPSSKDNHQFENANFYEQYGCNWIMNQNEINETNLTSKLIHIIQDKKEYLKKKNNMKNFNFQNSWNNVNQKIIDTINEN